MSEIQELHPLARRFAEEYCRDFNVTKASERAGIVRSHGEELLRDVRVQALITDAKRKASGRVNLSVDLMLETVRAIAVAVPVDARAILRTEDDEGNPCMPYLDFEELDEDQRRAIKGVKWTKEGPQIEWYSVLEAVKLGGQFFTMWKEGVELTGPGGGPIDIGENISARDAMDVYRQMVEGGK